MNKNIKLILSVAICIFLVATAFNATGIVHKSDENNTGEIINEQVPAPALEHRLTMDIFNE